MHSAVIKKGNSPQKSRLSFRQRWILAKKGLKKGPRTIDNPTKKNNQEKKEEVVHDPPPPHGVDCYVYELVGLSFRDERLNMYHQMKLVSKTPEVGTHQYHN